MEHYAVAFIGLNEEIDIQTIVDAKKFTYAFHIGFQPKASKYVVDFVKRFQKDYNGINLFITT